MRNVITGFGNTLKIARNEILIEIIKTRCVILNSIGDLKRSKFLKKRLNLLEKELIELNINDYGYEEN